MQFHAQLLPNGRFGIYVGSHLLATIGCAQACQEMLNVLQKRQLEACMNKSVRVGVSNHKERSSLAGR